MLYINIIDTFVQVQQEEVIEVEVTPGLKDDEKIILKGKGDEVVDPDIPAGDVHIVIDELVI